MRNCQVLLVASMIVLFCGTNLSAQIPLNQNTMWQSAYPDVYSTGMIWDDVNNDGYIDLFLSNGNDIVMAPNEVYLNRFGVMESSPSWLSSNAEYSGHCAVGDINDDGFVDLAVANFLGSGGFPTPNLANLYLSSEGLLSYSPDWYSGDSIWSFSCALGDADGDGDLDLALATGDGYTSQLTPERIYFNVDGEFESLPGWQSDRNAATMDVTWGDVNNDGYLDLAFAYDALGAAVYYSNNGTIETTPSWESSELEAANTLIFGDVNGDGWLDLIVAFNSQLGGNGYFRAYFNDGSGNLSTTSNWNSATGGYGSAVSMYDVDNDGDDDLAAGRWWDSPRIYENLGTTFTNTPVWQANNATVVEELAWVDIDGDGLEQLADTIYPPSTIKLFYTEHHPLYSIDSVKADGLFLEDADYCFDLISGWVSIGQGVSSSVEIYYQYSFKNDIALSNWDTHSMVYGHTSSPLVDFSADNTFGWAPLTTQFTDNSVGASDRLWRFGDGDSSGIDSPAHEYTEGGAYDVYLANTQADGWHNHTNKKMIVVLADTLSFPTTGFFSTDTLRLPVNLTNSQPLESIRIPVSYSGPIDLTYVGMTTEGTRTEYFEQATIVTVSPSTHRLVLRLVAAGVQRQPPLPAGEGTIAILKFVRDGGGGVTWIDTTHFSGHPLECDAGYVSYAPFVVSGYVFSMSCGDINGDGDGPDVADLTFLVDYLFAGGTAPNPYLSGDVNASGGVDVADLTYMVDYLFGGGPPPQCE